MTWDHLTEEQRQRIAERQAAIAAQRAATYGTPDCMNCEDAERAGGAWWLNEAFYCDCSNGQATKARHAQQREELAAENAAIAARAARACSRCGGSGRYGHWGECYRCHGSGVDPKARKGVK